MLISNGSFANKEHSESVLSAVRGNSASRTGYHDPCIGSDFLYLVYTEIYDLGIAARMCNEHLIDVDVARVSHTVGNVERKDRSKLSAVFLINAHFTALDGNAGLELKQVCAECRQSRASAALVQKLKAIDNEGGIHVFRETSTLVGDLLRALSLLGKLCRSKNEKSCAG